jgi:hypothetical protein
MYIAQILENVIATLAPALQVQVWSVSQRYHARFWVYHARFWVLKQSSRQIEDCHDRHTCPGVLRERTNAPVSQ